MTYIAPPNVQRFHRAAIFATRPKNMHTMAVQNWHIVREAARRHILREQNLLSENQLEGIFLLQQIIENEHIANEGDLYQTMNLLHQLIDAPLMLTEQLALTG